MEHYIKTSEPCGRTLWLTDGNTQVGIALDFGIRVVHLSCVGMENLFYTQPADGSDGFVLENGWRVRGGHRFWLAPESADSYAPDNDPIAYTILSDGVWLTQKEDTQLCVRKSLGITFCNGIVRLEHQIENLAGQTKEWALWGVNTVDGGQADIPFPPGGYYSPYRSVSLWGDTNLHDPRLQFDRDKLTVRHAAIDGYCKLGLSHTDGTAILRSKGQILKIASAVDPTAEYPDRGCNFEVYANRLFMELETLSPLYRLQPGQIASHMETWELKPE